MQSLGVKGKVRPHAASQPSTKSLISRGLVRDASNRVQCGCKDVPKDTSPKRTYSLYSSESENDKVGGINSGLNRCASLLANILEENEGKPVKDVSCKISGRRRKGPLKSQDCVMPKFTCKKPRKGCMKKPSSLKGTSTAAQKKNVKMKKAKFAIQTGMGIQEMDDTVQSNGPQAASSPITSPPKEVPLATLPHKHRPVLQIKDGCAKISNVPELVKEERPRNDSLSSYHPHSRSLASPNCLQLEEALLRITSKLNAPLSTKSLVTPHEVDSCDTSEVSLNGLPMFSSRKRLLTKSSVLDGNHTLLGDSSLAITNRNNVPPDHQNTTKIGVDHMANQSDVMGSFSICLDEVARINDIQSWKLESGQRTITGRQEESRKREFRRPDVSAFNEVRRESEFKSPQRKKGFLQRDDRVQNLTDTMDDPKERLPSTIVLRSPEDLIALKPDRNTTEENCTSSMRECETQDLNKDLSKDFTTEHENKVGCKHDSSGHPLTEGQASLSMDFEGTVPENDGLEMLNTCSDLLTKLESVISQILGNLKELEPLQLQDIAKLIERFFNCLQKQSPSIVVQEQKEELKRLRSENLDLAKRLETACLKCREYDQMTAVYEEALKTALDAKQENISAKNEQLELEKKIHDLLLIKTNMEEDINALQRKLLSKDEELETVRGSILTERGNSDKKNLDFEKTLAQSDLSKKLLQKENTILKITLQQSQAESDRLRELNKGLKQTITNLIEDLRKADSGPGHPNQKVDDYDIDVNDIAVPGPLLPKAGAVEDMLCSDCPSHYSTTSSSVDEFEFNRRLQVLDNDIENLLSSLRLKRLKS